MVRLGAGGGKRGGNKPARRQSNLSPQSACLRRCSGSAQQNPAGPNRRGKPGHPGRGCRRRQNAHRWYPVFRRGPHLSAESVRREKGGNGGPRAFLGPPALRESPSSAVALPFSRCRPSLLPLPTSHIRLPVSKLWDPEVKRSGPAPAWPAGGRYKGGCPSRKPEPASLGWPAEHSPVISVATCIPSCLSGRAVPPPARVGTTTRLLSNRAGLTCSGEGTELQKTPPTNRVKGQGQAAGGSGGLRERAGPPWGPAPKAGL